MRISIIFIVLLCLFRFSCFSQIPGGILDMSWYWQLSIESSQPNEGSKINLSNKDGETFLHLGSTHEKFDLFDPFISRSQESNLQFIVEDPEGTESNVQMTLKQDGNLQIQQLAGNSTRNLVALPDGTIRPQSFSGFAGVLALTPHDFVSLNNPGDDHNYGHGVIYHETNLGVGGEILVAPLHLPHGSVIKEITVFYNHPDNPEDTLEFYILKTEHLINLSYLQFIGFSEPDTVSYNPIPHVTKYLDYQIDNYNNYYYIRASNFGDSQNWPADDVGIESVRVIFEYPSG